MSAVQRAAYETDARSNDCAAYAHTEVVGKQ